MTELNVLKRDSKDNLAMLRSEGRTPGVCYGSSFENTLISFDQREFRKLYRDSGTSSVIDLTGDLKGEKCFIQDMDVHVVTGDILHADFKVVAAGEKTQVTVHVEIVGEAPAVAKKLGLLNQSLTEIDVEAIPSAIPSSIEIDVSELAEVGANIKVSDLKLTKGVIALGDADAIIVGISGLQEESEDEESTGPSLEDVLADPSAGAEDAAAE